MPEHNYDVGELKKVNETKKVRSYTVCFDNKSIKSKRDSTKRLIIDILETFIVLTFFPIIALILYLIVESVFLSI